MATKNKDIVYVLKMRNDAKAALRSYRGDLSSAAKAMQETAKQARDMARQARSLDGAIGKINGNLSGMSGKMNAATVALRETNKELSRLGTTANRSAKLGTNMQQAAQNVQSANAALRSLNSALNTFANTAKRSGVLATKLQQGAVATQGATVALRAATTQASAFARAANAAGAAMGGIGSRGARGAGGATSSFASLASSVGGLRNMLLGAASAAGSFFGAQKVFEYTDTFTAMNSQLRLVTQNTDQLNETYETLFQMAQNTRQSLDGTVNLYARISRATKSLNMSQQDTIDLTDAINKSVAIFGGPAASAQAALFQLSQGFAAGQLRGEELNSVLEQSPRLAQAIADGMGVAVGSLRSLAEEGKLTSDNVLKAIMSQRDVLDREFSQVGVTVGQAFTVANNAVLDYIGKVDKGAQTSQNFAKSVMASMEILRDPAMISGGVRVMEIFGQTLQGIIGTARFLATNLDLVGVAAAGLAAWFVHPAIVGFGGAMIATAKGVWAVVTALKAMGVAAAVTTARVKVMQLILSRTGVGLAVLAIGAGIAAWSRFTTDASEATEELERNIDAVRKAYNEAGGSAEDWTDKIKNLTATQAEANLALVRQSLEQARKELAGWNGFGTGQNYSLTANLLANISPEASGIPELIRQAQEGGISIEEFRKELDTIGQSTANDQVKQLVLTMLDSTEKFAQHSEEVARAEALLAVLTGTATDVQRAMILTGQSYAEAAASANDITIALNKYEDIIKKLMVLNPVDKDIVERMEDISTATALFEQAFSELEHQKSKGIISEEEYNRKLAEQTRLLQAAKDEAWGLVDARKDLKKYVEDSTLGGIFDSRAAAIEQEKRAYEELQKTLIEAKASETEFFTLLQTYQQNLANIDNKALYDIGKGLESNLRALENENRALGLNDAQRARLSAQIEAENAIREAGLEGTQQAIDAMRLYMQEYDKLASVANRAEMAEFVGTSLSDLKKQAALLGVAADKQDELNALIEFESEARRLGLTDIEAWRTEYVAALAEVKAAQDAVNQNFALGFGEGLREFGEGATNVREQAKGLASGIASDISGALKSALKGEALDLGELVASIGGRFIDMAVDNLVGHIAKNLGGMFDDGLSNDPVAKAQQIVNEQQNAYLMTVQGVEGAGQSFVAGLRMTFDQIIAGVQSIANGGAGGATGFTGLPSSTVTTTALPSLNMDNIGTMPSFQDMVTFATTGAVDVFQQKANEIDNVINKTFESLGYTMSDASQMSVDLLKKFEGFRNEAYWDVNHWRVGYGSDTITNPDGSYRTTQKDSYVSQAQADLDLARRVANLQQHSINKVGGQAWSNLGPGGQAAVTSAAYNYGSLDAPGLRGLVEAIKQGSHEGVAQALEALKGHNGGVNADRRQQEADMVRASSTNQQHALSTQQLQQAQQGAIMANQQLSMAYQQTGQATNTAAQGSQQASTAVQQLGTSAQSAAGQMQSASTNMRGMGGSIGMVGSNAQMVNPAMGGLGQGIMGLMGPLTQAIPGLGGFANMIMQVISSMGGMGGGMGGGGGMLGMLGGLFGFAKGGIMSPNGPLPLKTYAKGGIAKKPQVAVFGEGRQNEAFVPLPDGKTIPVTMNGSGENGGVTVRDINIDIKMQGSSGDPAKDQAHAENVASMLNKAIDQKMSEWYLRNSAPGGMINQNK